VTQTPDVNIRLRRFGRTDLTVSEYGLGCARIGGIFKRDPAEFINLLTAARDAGINFFDTADIYSQGESEVLLGRAFRGQRDKVVLASKAGYVLPAQRRFVARLKPIARPLIKLLRISRQNLPAAVRGSLAQDFTASHLRRAVEGSLQRLGTDHLDLFQLHSPPASVVEAGEWLQTLDGLRQQGKIRHYGISCDTAEAAAAALACSSVSSIQIPINLLEREFIRLLPRAAAQGVAVIARECLANGLLVKETAAIDVAAYCRSAEEAALKTDRLETCRQAAVENSCTLPTLALKFVNDLAGVSVSLIGVSRQPQLETLLAGGLGSPTGAALRGIPQWT
jgi:aryl-alcohol dehydrogenase-like predicted oxidoreductase